MSMSETSQPAESSVADTIESNNTPDAVSPIEVPLQAAISERLKELTDTLLGAPEVVGVLLPLVKGHLIAETDAVIPRAREHLSQLDAIAHFTARFKMLLSPPPPLADWMLTQEAKRILEEDREALGIWPKPEAPLRKCVHDVLSDRDIARPTCVRVLSDSALLDALKQADAAGESYVAKRIAEHILKGDKAPRRAARLYARRYAEQMGRNKTLRGLSVVVRGYWVWSYLRRAIPIVIDLGVLFGVASAGLPIMFATQTCGRRVTSIINFSFKQFCAYTAL